MCHVHWCGHGPIGPCYLSICSKPQLQNRCALLGLPSGESSQDFGLLLWLFCLEVVVDEAAQVIEPGSPSDSSCGFTDSDVWFDECPLCVLAFHSSVLAVRCHGITCLTNCGAAKRPAVLLPLGKGAVQAVMVGGARGVVEGCVP